MKKSVRLGGGHERRQSKINGWGTGKPARAKGWKLSRTLSRGIPRAPRAKSVRKEVGENLRISTYAEPIFYISSAFPGESYLRAWDKK